ncbi:MAG: phosphoribosylformylglycinamidine synthase subunit PurS [Spirochaetales bacterium]|nr:phosphoribosylformylglycinamidine synthase subunit PurS [Leptospiraceae bacterium]MCP5480811.1 phosphoribosylformylglycinamidine synthase subunit PurS [Spirochaetales bacterium]
MGKFLAKVYIQLKESILDPQGQAVIHALHNLGHQEAEDVRIGKYIEVRLSAENKSAAEARVHEYCGGLLANPVIETYRFELTEA